ncbi:MAG: hypothetical protein HY897_02005 [Deltaproteobacteria bacterium]|nr:hypothetical protein [Deltaproteobacteria bacterium]
MYQKVVIRFWDDTTMRGYAENFAPDKGLLTLSPAGRAGTHVLVRLDDVKAVFFVKNMGSPGRNKKKGFSQDDRRLGTRVMVEFKDGEKMWGAVFNAAAIHGGDFFLYPADGSSNNEKVFIPRNAIAAIHQG